MSDRLFFSLGALVAVLMIALALVVPQGLGARSPRPFGHALGPVENDVPLAARKPLRARSRAQTDPNALTAPIPAPPGLPEAGARATHKPAAPVPASRVTPL